MNLIIRNKLIDIMDEFEVRVLFACEAGSRAWGLHHDKSDYDVRFVFMHKNPEKYLTVGIVDPIRDIQKVDEDFDITGWDFQKALKLFHKSNPSLMEWLNSDTVYFNLYDFQERLRSMAEVYHSPTVLCYHYYHMAKGNYREYLKSSHVKLKKYFNVIRPLLAIRWIEQERGLIPMNFELLTQSVLPMNSRTYSALWDLVESKKSGNLDEYGFRVDVLNEFIESELQRHEENSFQRNFPKADPKLLDDFFLWYWKQHVGYRRLENPLLTI